MPKLATSNDGLLLDYKARQTILQALRFQIAAWESKTAAEMDEDDYADLGNDILYARTLLGSLEANFGSKS